MQGFEGLELGRQQSSHSVNSPHALAGPDISNINALLTSNTGISQEVLIIRTDLVFPGAHVDSTDMLAMAGGPPKEALTDSEQPCANPAATIAVVLRTLAQANAAQRTELDWQAQNKASLHFIGTLHAGV